MVCYPAANSVQVIGGMFAIAAVVELPDGEGPYNSKVRMIRVLRFATAQCERVDDLERSNGIAKAQFAFARVPRLKLNRNFR